MRRYVHTSGTATTTAIVTAAAAAAAAEVVRRMQVAAYRRDDDAADGNDDGVDCLKARSKRMKSQDQISRQREIRKSTLRERNWTASIRQYQSHLLFSLCASNVRVCVQCNCKYD